MSVYNLQLSGVASCHISQLAVNLLANYVNVYSDAVL